MHRARVLTTIGIGLAALIVFGCSIVLGFQIATWNRVLPGVSVLNVDVGGLSVSEARTRLSPVSARILDQPLVIQLGERSWTTSARDMGVRLDPIDLAQAAYAFGRQGSPQTVLAAQVDALQVRHDVPVVEQADGSRLDALLTRIAAQIDRPARNARLTLSDDGVLDYGTSETGLKLDQAASRAEVAQALTTGATQVSLVTHPVEPTLRTEQVESTYQQLQRILAPDPIDVSAAEFTRKLQRAEVLDMITLTPAAGPGTSASVTLKPDVLDPLLDAAAKAIDTKPINARFTWDGAKLAVQRASRDGRAVDRDAAHALLESQILAGTRTIRLPVSVVAPDVSSDDGGARLGIRELIEQSTTSFAGAVPEKAHNIRLAAQRLNGVVVPPGGTFSFNHEVGPTTLEAGFQWGFGLVAGSAGNAHTVPSVAGGICQVATTLFQPVFWGGYQLEERYWHLYWIPAYTSRDVVGLDATVDADSGLDLKWINPTDDPVLIQSYTEGDRVTFRLYGKKPAWTVQVEPAVVSDRVSPDPTPDVQQEPLLPWGKVVPVETARDGFQVVLTRHVLGNDGKQRDLVLKSTYQPGHTVTLVGTGGAPDSASVSAAVDRVRARMQPAAPPAAPTTYATPNGPRSLAQIRDELRRAGWGGGSDQDAVATYNRLAESAAGR